MDKNQAAAHVFNKLAAEYQNKYMDVGLYRRSLDLFCDALMQDAKVLDVACGPGNVSKYLLDKRPDLNLLGMDIAPNMVQLARINNPSAGYMVADGRKLLEVNQRFDAVMCAFLFPYLSVAETMQFIEDASKILNPGGVLYISTMEDQSEKSGWHKGSGGDEVYMNYHEYVHLEKALLNHNFKIIHVENIKHPTQLGSTARDLILIAKL